MLKCLRWFVWGFMLLVFFPALLAAQNFVYTNNDITGPNSVSAFSVDDPSLCPPGTTTLPCQISGSPFLTGGEGIAGTSYSPNRIIVVKVKSSQNDFVYASNAGGSDCYPVPTVSAFKIDASTGALTQVLPPPDLTCSTGNQTFPTDGFNGVLSGTSLAATPDGKYLYAGTTGFGTITIFSIDPTTGGLSKQGSVSASGPMYSMKVSPNGKFLVVPFECSSCTDRYGLDVFSIDSSNGPLHLASVTPYVFSSVPVTSVAINKDADCASTLLFAGTQGSTIYVSNFDSTSGALSTPLAFSTVDSITGNPVSRNQVVLLSPDDSTLFSSNYLDSKVTAFAVSGFDLGPGGSGTVLGSSVSAGPGAILLSGLAVSQDGAFLYAAGTVSISGTGYGGISTFTLDSTKPPTLTPDSPTSTGVSTGISRLNSLAAYPANACFSPAPPPSNSLAVSSLEVSGGPPPAFELDAMLSLEGSLGANPFLDQPVTIEVGDFALTVPAGSFKTFQHGRNAGTDLFQGVVESTTLKVQITPLGRNESGQNQFQIHALDKQVDLVGLDSPVTVMIKVGAEDNSPTASDSVTPTFPSSVRGNWRDF